MSEMEKLSIFREGFKSGFVVGVGAVSKSFHIPTPDDSLWDAEDEAMVRENYLKYITKIQRAGVAPSIPLEVQQLLGDRFFQRDNMNTLCKVCRGSGHDKDSFPVVEFGRKRIKDQYKEVYVTLNKGSGCWKCHGTGIIGERNGS